LSIDGHQWAFAGRLQNQAGTTQAGAAGLSSSLGVMIPFSAFSGFLDPHKFACPRAKKPQCKHALVSRKSLLPKLFEFENHYHYEDEESKVTSFPFSFGLYGVELLVAGKKASSNDLHLKQRKLYASHL
jgi:hypothetical protein